MRRLAAGATALLATPAHAEVCDKGPDGGAWGVALLLIVVPLVVLLAVALLDRWRPWLWLLPSGVAALLAGVSWLDLTETNPTSIAMRDAAIREGCGVDPMTGLIVWGAVATICCALALRARLLALRRRGQHKP